MQNGLATSALDDETDELINERVMKQMAGKTVIVVTHRSSFSNTAMKYSKLIIQN